MERDERNLYGEAEECAGKIISATCCGMKRCQPVGDDGGH